MVKPGYVSYEHWWADLKKVPKEDQADWIYDTLRSKKNLHIFGRYFFPHIIKGNNEVPDCHLDLIQELSSPGDSAVIFPRGFAKSTWIKIDTLHDIVYGLEPVILYIGVTLRDAQYHFESMKVELENNDRMYTVYGNLVPEGKDKSRSHKWTNTHFATTNNINCVARGAGKGRGVNINNQRPTKIIADDIEEDEQVRSPDRRTKLHNWLYQVVIPSKDKKRGRLKMLGTVLHQACEVLQFYQGHGGVFYQATVGGVPIDSPNAESIWPNFWSIDDLIKVRDGYTKKDGTQTKGIGTRAFNQEYMNEPLSDDMANLKPAWIDENIFVGLPKATIGRWRYVIHCDPQAGETSGADEYAITVLAYMQKDSHRYVVEQIAGRDRQMEQAKKLIQMWIKYPTAHIVSVEKVLNQTAVYQHVVDWKNGNLRFDGIPSGKRDIPIRGTSPKDAKSKYGSDKLGRLQSLEPMFERGEVHLRPEMKRLRDQLLFLGTNLVEHDDRADSLIGALELSNKGGFGDTDKSEYTSTSSSTIMGNMFDKKF